MNVWTRSMNVGDLMKENKTWKTSNAQMDLFQTIPYKC